jgi:hypothetical protein
MIKMLYPPTIKRTESTCALVLWLGAAFDQNIPFRRVLSEILACLQQTGQAELALPVFEPAEDFVEGGLSWRGVNYSVYYEYSLGFLELTAPNDYDFEQLMKLLQPHLVVQETPKAE